MILRIQSKHTVDTVNGCVLGINVSLSAVQTFTVPGEPQSLLNLSLNNSVFCKGKLIFLTANKIALRVGIHFIMEHLKITQL